MDYHDALRAIMELSVWTCYTKPTPSLPTPAEVCIFLPGTAELCLEHYSILTNDLGARSHKRTNSRYAAHGCCLAYL